MKFQRIPEIIDAEEYKEGMEDGWIVFFSGNMFDYEEHFDNKDYAQEFIEDNMGYPLVDTEDKDHEIIYEEPCAYIKICGEARQVWQGCFIVTNANGDRAVYHSDDFYRFFEKVHEPL